MIERAEIPPNVPIRTCSVDPLNPGGHVEHVHRWHTAPPAPRDRWLPTLRLPLGGELLLLVLPRAPVP
jgi:hypothetical protein